MPQIRRQDHHAVVIGASVAGLMTARVLSDHYENVTVVDRDMLPKSVKSGRKGIPQGTHIHILLQRGQQIIARNFPGLLEEIADGGQGFTDFGRDLAWYYYGAWRTRFNSGIPMLQCTRTFLEGHLRKRVQAIPNIKFVTGYAVKEFLSELNGHDSSAQDQAAGSRVVTGVRLEPAPPATTVAPKASTSKSNTITVRTKKKTAAKTKKKDLELVAELVVDASGRGSQAPKWLENLGYDRPREEHVTIGLAYTTRIFQMKRDPLEHGLSFIGVYPRPPVQKRAGFLYRIETGRWLVSLNGYFGDHAPLDDQGFMDFAQGLADPVIYNYIKNAKAISPITRHKIPSNQRRRYDQMSRFPKGFIALGDSVCSFNPIFGQGMTMSCIGAETLGQMLAERADTRSRTQTNAAKAKSVGTENFSLRFQKRLVRLTELPWTLTTTEDLRYEKSEGRRPLILRPFNWYKTQIIELCSTDPYIYSRFAQLLHMQKGLTVLMTPGVIWRAIRHGIRSQFRSLEERANTKTLPPMPMRGPAVAAAAAIVPR